MADGVIKDPWRDLSVLTSARIALGRVGASLPTQEVLKFSLAHARARDAVHAEFDAEGLGREIEALGWPTLQVASAAPDRTTYLRRPDLGRCLDEAGRVALSDIQRSGFDIAIVVADGLSASAVHRQAGPLLAAFKPYAMRAGWKLAPIILAQQARVALGDEIGALLRARLTILLVGERPGLSSADSLGVYLTYAPRRGRNDAERNCISNIRQVGLTPERAAFKLAWLVDQALTRGLTGVALKDESDVLLPTGEPSHLLR